MSIGLIEAGDPIAFAITLRRACSERGLTCTVADAIDLVNAYSFVGAVREQELYIVARAILVHRREDFDRFDLAFFDALDRHLQDHEPPLSQGDGFSLEDGGMSRAEVVIVPGLPEGAMPLSPGLSYSAYEQLIDRDIAHCSEIEIEMIAEVLDRLARLTGTQRRNRLALTRHRSRVIDLRRSLGRARATEGEIIRLSYRARTMKWRRSVFLLDISGSMDSYAPTLLRMIWGFAQGPAPIEAFCLGTRLTRVSRMLVSKDRERAIAAIGTAVTDRSGGTRLGETLFKFNRDFGIRGVARAANVVILSDGLDRGDPELLGEQMARIGRVAHRVIWVNPLKAGRGYAPLARGMQVGLRHVDHFVEGHSLRSLAALVDLLASDRRPRDDVGSRFGENARMF